jgi:hypothetical protein
MTAASTRSGCATRAFSVTLPPIDRPSQPTRSESRKSSFERFTAYTALMVSTAYGSRSS